MKHLSVYIATNPTKNIDFYHSFHLNSTRIYIPLLDDENLRFSQNPSFRLHKLHFEAGLLEDCPIIVKTYFGHFKLLDLAAFAMTEGILPAAKISRQMRVQRLVLLPPHEKSRPIYASKLRFSTVVSPTLPPLPPLISPLSFESTLTPLTPQQSNTTTSFSCAVENRSPKPSPLSSHPRFQRKQNRTKRATTSVAGTVETCPPHPPLAKWRCHICGKRYAIGVTRRCLKDGHSLCFPVIVNKPQLNSKPTQEQPSVGNEKVAKEEGRNDKAKAVMLEGRK